MSLHEEWKKLADAERTQQEYDKFWMDYFAKEKDNYAKILGGNTKVLSGRLSDLAGQYDMDPVFFLGFIDGINTSLEIEVSLDELTEDSELNAEINFEKLYYNMLDAKADWLYNLPEWEDILPEERRKEIKKTYNTDNIAISNKVGRNDPCPCGSGKKYKKCCGAA